MDISLTPALKRFVEEQVATGAYDSPDDVIRASIRLLKKQAAEAMRQEEWLQDALDKGLAQLDAGDVVDGEEVFKELLSRHKRNK